MPAALDGPQARARALAAASVAVRHAQRLVARACEECSAAGVTYVELTGELDDLVRQLRQVAEKVGGMR